MQQTIRLKPENVLLNIITEIQWGKNKHFPVHILTTARIAYAKYWKKEELNWWQKSTAKMDCLPEKLKENPDQRIMQAWTIICNRLEQISNR